MRVLILCSRQLFKEFRFKWNLNSRVSAWPSAVGRLPKLLHFSRLNMLISAIRMSFVSTTHFVFITTSLTMLSVFSFAHSPFAYDF